MGRIIGVYGVIGGVIVAIGMLAGIIFVSDHGIMGMVVGYLTMLVALSMVFVGVKRYRDTIEGGVVRFLPAFGIGLGIALVASMFYVVAWEIYMYATNYSFMEQYVASAIRGMQAAGKPAADIAKFSTEMDALKVQYADPLFRMAMTLAEIAPVGLLVSLVSAVVLRNSGAFPAKVARD